MVGRVQIREVGFADGDVFWGSISVQLLVPLLQELLLDSRPAQRAKTLSVCIFVSQGMMIQHITNNGARFRIVMSSGVVLVCSF